MTRPPFTPGSLPAGQLERRRDRLERQQMLDAIAVLDLKIAAEVAHEDFHNRRPDGILENLFGLTGAALHARFHELQAAAVDANRAACAAMVAYRERWTR